MNDDSGEQNIVGIHPKKQLINKKPHLYVLKLYKIDAIMLRALHLSKRLLSAVKSSYYACK